MMNFKHWQINKDADNIIWAYLDRADSSANSLNVAVMTELQQVIDHVTADQSAIGLIIASKKTNGFIAGADIEQFKLIESYEQAKVVIDGGQTILNNLEKLKIPTLAMISGFCLGGGLELALACRYRIAEDSDKTKLGLPEIKLGIQPGWGGTVRLPRLIGAPAALEMILTGRMVSANAAKKMGFVDYAVPTRQLMRAAVQLIKENPGAHQPSFLQSISNTAPVRALLGAYLKKQTLKKADPAHYPAPFAIINNWIKAGGSFDKAMALEADSICKLLLTDTSANLVNVFFLQEKLKSLAKVVKFKAQHVHVVGAGTMGGDIAAWCALKGMTVTLQDREAAYIAPAIKRAHATFKKKFKRDKRGYQAALDRLIPDVTGQGIKQADVIIEAIFENLDAKQTLFKLLEATAKPDAILATNTSSIPLAEISACMTDPKRLVGIHFFNPVAMMMLVEVVKAKQTDQHVAEQAQAFVGQLGKLPLPVTSSPGFLVNRILMPYLMECVTLLEEGIPAPVIDKAAKAFGLAMGPVQLADTVGLDVCLFVAKNLVAHYGGTIPQRLIDMVESKHLGVKTGRGFYTYDKQGKPDRSQFSTQSALTATEISDRLVLRMVNEAAACLREGVVASPELLDAGMIFATGFAPFHGGIIAYVRKVGQEALLARFATLQERYGARFQPDPGLMSHVFSNEM